MKGLVGSFKAIALDDLHCDSLLTVSFSKLFAIQDTTSLSGLVILLSNENPSIISDILEVILMGYLPF